MLKLKIFFRRLVNATATTTRTAANVTSAAPDSGTSLIASSVSVTATPTRVTRTLASVLTAKITQPESKYLNFIFNFQFYNFFIFSLCITFSLHNMLKKFNFNLLLEIRTKKHKKAIFSIYRKKLFLRSYDC